MQTSAVLAALQEAPEPFRREDRLSLHLLTSAEILKNHVGSHGRQKVSNRNL